MLNALFRRCVIAFVCLGVPSLAATSPAQESHVYVEPSVSLIRDTMSVPPGQLLPFELSLTGGMTLVADFQVNRGQNYQVNAWLLDLANFQRMSDRQQFSFFKGTSETIRGVARYKFVIPQTNVYYLVVDNRRSLLFTPKGRAYAYAVSPTTIPESLAYQRKIEEVYQGLKRFFVFQDFRISARRCGLASAWTDPDVTMCIELMETLADQQLVHAMTFVLLHKLGRNLLRLWGYPMWDNEDDADQFTTVFLVLGKQQAAALQAAQWWASQTSEGEAREKLWLDDRHTLSPQRARNIMSWLNREENLLRRWQKLLVPNMQTDALKSLDGALDQWIDHPLIRGELEGRGVRR